MRYLSCCLLEEKKLDMFLSGQQMLTFNFH